mmetsp:Transcript_13110/g.28448  ORF Transcript_13110/g.28448 Transcript_13110/m.28448 type:complete len:604 (-) Transcript_13110:149-1960(-)
MKNGGPKSSNHNGDNSGASSGGYQPIVKGRTKTCAREDEAERTEALQLGVTTTARTRSAQKTTRIEIERGTQREIIGTPHTKRGGASEDITLERGSNDVHHGAVRIPGIGGARIVDDRTSYPYRPRRSSADGILVEAELAPDVDLVVAESTEYVGVPVFSGSDLLLPKFSEESERKFEKEHVVFVQAATRIILPIVAALYLAFLGWDAVQPGFDIGTSSMVRFPVGFLGIFISRVTSTDVFVSWNQIIVCSYYTLGAFSVVYILSTLEDGFLVGSAGICTCNLCACTLALMRLRYAFVYCCLVLMFTDLFIVFDKQNDIVYTLVTTNYFIVVFSILGLIFLYVVELNLRVRFRDTGTIFSWTNQYAAMQENRHPSSISESRPNMDLNGGSAATGAAATTPRGDDVTRGGGGTASSGGNGPVRSAPPRVIDRKEAAAVSGSGINASRSTSTRSSIATPEQRLLQKIHAEAASSEHPDHDQRASASSSTGLLRVRNKISADIHDQEEKGGVRLVDAQLGAGDERNNDLKTISTAMSSAKTPVPEGLPVVSAMDPVPPPLVGSSSTQRQTSSAMEPVPQPSQNYIAESDTSMGGSQQAAHVLARTY